MITPPGSQRPRTNAAAFAAQHTACTRRHFLQLGTAGLAALGSPNLWAKQVADELAANPILAKAVGELEYLTPLSKFKFGGRGTPRIHEIPPEKLPAIGLTHETWRLEIDADPASNSEIGQPLTQTNGRALDWAGLMRLADSHAVRFLHVLTCTNVPQPFGMGLWEGVPLRTVLWKIDPRKNIRRIFYYGYHNDDPKQRFQSSLPINRILEEAPGELPVILCYKLNGQLLSQAGGGPVRMVVPGFYGNKSIKWLQRIVVTNSFQANDSYAELNNDVEGPLKTCAHFVHTPATVKVGQPFALTGFAQVGTSGLKRVQYWLKPTDQPLPADDPYLTRGEWRDATLLPPPEKWGRDLPDGQLPRVLQVDPETGQPFTWPIPNTVVHWATTATVATPGTYELRCRTVDANGIAQPLPRPFGRSGANAIRMVKLKAEAA